MQSVSIRTYFLLIAILIVSAGYSQTGNNVEEFALLEERLEKISGIQGENSLVILRQMQEIADKNPKQPILRIKALYYKSLFNIQQGINEPELSDEVSSLLEAGNPAFEEEYYLLVAKSYNFISQEDYMSAFNSASLAYEKTRETDDAEKQAIVLNILGNICNLVSLFDMAEDYYSKALDVLDTGSSQHIYYSILRNRFEIDVKSGKYKEIPDFIGNFSAYLPVLDSLDMQDLLVNYFISMGNYYMMERDPEQALDYQLKALDICRDNPYVYSIGIGNIGIYYMGKGDYAKALGYFNTCKQIWEENNKYQLLSILYSQYSYLYEYRHKPDSALHYSRKAQEMTDKVNHYARITETHRKYISTSLEAAENKLMLARTEISLKNKQSLIFLLSSLTAIGFVLFILLFFRQKRKSMQQQILLKEAETKELQAIRKAQEDQLENRLREITSISLLLSSKNQVLNRILNISERISPADKAIKKEIRTVVGENMRTEDSWNDFMLHFNKVHPLFFERLQQNYPDLTQNDLRLAAYIRIGLSSKQIAQMLNISPNSVRINRSRLKKKLNLEQEDALENFIQSV